jgi:hypothetical protein
MFNMVHFARAGAQESRIESAVAVLLYLASLSRVLTSVIVVITTITENFF